MEQVRGSFVDRAIAALTAAGTSLTTGQLIARAAPAPTVRSAVQKLAADQRLMRTGLNRWGLADTGAAPYRALDVAAAAPVRRSRGGGARWSGAEGLLRPPG
ncbi:hypothetical protein [Actinocatenispora rupis]|uniref:hypothetical protein n=1 Tax=Actinocatenispora rupis TaxID=519421 RepID=UPI0019439E1E|nr:hypothetical protein [Actinocatenispora rupis]